jgi:hypothetical protein
VFIAELSSMKRKTIRFDRKANAGPSASNGIPSGLENLIGRWLISEFQASIISGFGLNPLIVSLCGALQ